MSYVPPTGRVWHKAFLGGVRPQGRIPDTTSGSQNAKSSVGIPLKGPSQAINLAPPKRVRVWGDGPQKHEDAGLGATTESMSDAPTGIHVRRSRLTASRARTHQARSMYQPALEGIFVSASHQARLDTRSDDTKVDYSGDLGEGKVGHVPRLDPCLLDYAGHRPT